MATHIDGINGARGPVKKPTGFMSSSKFIAAKLNRRCPGEHTHVHLMGGRAAAAQEYPPDLCKAIIEGVISRKSTIAKTESVRRL